MTKPGLVGAAAAAAVIAVAGVIALVTRADDDAQPGRAGQSQSAAGDPTASTDSTAPGATTPTTAAGAPGAPGAAAKPTAWRRPDPGRYRFHVSRTGAGANEHDGTLDVAHGNAGVYIETRDLGAYHLRRSFAPGNDGLRETSFTIESTSGPARCTWSTPLLVIPALAADGQAFEAKATCTTDVAGTKAVIEHTSTNTVVGMRSAQTPDGTTPLLRIDRQVTTRTTTGNRVAERRSQFVQYYDVARGLLAESTEEAAETGPSGTSSFRIVETMLTLQPEDR